MVKHLNTTRSSLIAEYSSKVFGAETDVIITSQAE